MLTQKKLYLVIINMGGYVHEKIYVLTRRNNEFFDECYDYWDRSENYGFMGDDNRKLGPKKHDGYWEFLFEDKKEAQTFLDGAMAAKQFLLNLLK